MAIEVTERFKLSFPIDGVNSDIYFYEVTGLASIGAAGGEGNVEQVKIGRAGPIVGIAPHCVSSTNWDFMLGYSPNITFTDGANNIWRAFKKTGINIAAEPDFSMQEPIAGAVGFNADPSEPVHTFNVRCKNNDGSNPTGAIGFLLAIAEGTIVPINESIPQS